MKELQVRQGIKAKGNTVKVLNQVYNGKEIEFVPKEDLFGFAHKAWKKDSKQHNVMKKLTLDDVTHDDQVNKYKNITTQFAYEISTYLNNVILVLKNKYYQILKENEDVKKLYQELIVEEKGQDNNFHFRDDFDTLILDAIDNYFGDYQLRYTAERTPLSSEYLDQSQILVDIGTFMSGDETVIDDCTIVATTKFNYVVQDRFVNLQHPKRFFNLLMTILNGYYDDILRDVYDLYYCVFSKAYYIAIQYRGYATYPAIVENNEKIQQELLKAEEDFRNEMEKKQLGE